MYNIFSHIQNTLYKVYSNNAIYFVIVASIIIICIGILIKTIKQLLLIISPTLNSKNRPISLFNWRRNAIRKEQEFTEKAVVDNFYDKSNTIYVYKVTTPRDIARGLMYRTTPLEQNQGMLFDKGDWSTSGFWMKNTYIPLDILFLDNEYNVIDILYDMKPHDTTSRNIGKPWRYAIEINAGSMRHIVPGSKINVISIL